METLAAGANRENILKQEVFATFKCGRHSYSAPGRVDMIK